jgi:hypothetical protein
MSGQFLIVDNGVIQNLYAAGGEQASGGEIN